MRTRSAVLLPLLLGLALSPAPIPVVSAQQPSAFSVRDEMIPMRDGVKLHAKIFTPTDHPAPLPFIMLRTPYGVEDAADNFQGYFKELADDGYLFVFQDIRGRYKSEGTFVMKRPARAPGDPKAIDEGTDAFDTIDWLVKNVPENNGRVGMLGISYAAGSRSWPCWSRTPRSRRSRPRRRRPTCSWATTSITTARSG